MSFRSYLSWLVLAAALHASGSAEQDYLTNKWRKDSGDPATGKNGPALRADLEGLMPVWEKESSWTMAKAKAFCYLCDGTAGLSRRGRES